MKFEYTGSGLNNYYGINAVNGDVIEAEGFLINKMTSHPDFKEDGGSTSTELEDARLEYKELAGKLPHHKSGLDKIKADIQALKDEQDKD